MAFGERAVAEGPSSSEAHHWLGKAYGLKAKEAAVVQQFSLAKRCRVELARAVELDPANFGAALDLVRYDARAPKLLGGGKEKARALAARIGERNPARGHVALGVIAEIEKDEPAAEREYRAALASNPADGDALSALSDHLAARGRFDEAITLCRAAAAHAPDDPRPWFEIGLLPTKSRRELAKGMEALDHFLAMPALPDGPQPSDARWRKGELLALSGDLEAARAELVAALALEPGHQGARAALTQLDAAMARGARSTTRGAAGRTR